MEPGHVVLLGDSIFDNGRYVPDRPAVIDQVRQNLPRGWKASLLARDGHIAIDVVEQIARLPEDATHLVISAGGNDALGELSLLRELVRTVQEALGHLAKAVQSFRDDYRRMLGTASALGKPIAVCTVYDAVPDLSVEEKVALVLFNDVILRAAIDAKAPVIDLRLVCASKGDYSPLSPIEPSHMGGAKIAQAIAHVVIDHDFGTERTSIYHIPPMK